jgi:hypothetical protein
VDPARNEGHGGIHERRCEQIMALKTMESAAPVEPDGRDWDLSELAEQVSDAMAGVICDALNIVDEHCPKAAEVELVVEFACGARKTRIVCQPHAKSSVRGYMFHAEHPDDIDDRATVVSSRPLGGA